MVQIDEAAHIVWDAGGRLIGRTRLQKLAYVFEASGLGAGFNFEYRRFGPYSDELHICVQDAALLKLIDEQEHDTAWGGKYSVYTSSHGARDGVHPARPALAKLATHADAVALELAATAVFLFHEGIEKPWEEVARRKPEKVKGGRLTAAKALYQQMRKIETPVPLPDIAA